MPKQPSYDWQPLQAQAENPIWITDNAQLASACARWQNLPLIALDTEFSRVETFYPVPGLLQVADDEACYLIDPLQVDDFGPFRAVLEDETIIKVLHSASEDLELFRHSYQVVPKPLFDTQVAAAFANWGFSMGLQRLVKHALEIDLGKAQTTSDWLQRPLTAEQIHYAALDVAYLPAIALCLIAELKQLQRLDWVVDECAYIAQQEDPDPEGYQYYRRFTQMSIRSDAQLAGLRDLTAWREQACRERNLCRPRVLKNELILEIVKRWPQNLETLARLGVWRRTLKEDGPSILACLAQAEESARRHPPLPIHLPLHVYWHKPVKKLLALGRERARELDIFPEILIRRKDIEKLINSRDEQGQFHLPLSLSGWRKSLIGDDLLSALQALDPKRESEC